MTRGLPHAGAAKKGSVWPGVWVRVGGQDGVWRCRLCCCILVGMGRQDKTRLGDVVKSDLDVRVRALELAVEFAARTFTGNASPWLVVESARDFERYLSGTGEVRAVDGEYAA